MIFDKYPYTDFHELNLDYILNRMTDLETSYANFKSYVDGVIDEYGERLDGLIDEVQVKLDTQIAEVNALISDFTDEINGKISDFTADINDKITTFSQLINAKIASLEAEMSAFTAQIEEKITDLEEHIEEYIDLQMVPIRDDITGLDARITAIEAQGYPDFYNPFTGYVENLAPIIMSIYDGARHEPLTAQEYEDLELTAAEYDAYNLTAYEYDMRGKSLLVS